MSSETKGEEETVVMTRSRANTTDAALTAVSKGEGDSLRFVVVSSEVVYTDRSTGSLRAAELKGAEKVCPATYLMTFQLTNAPTWRGERKLFSRGTGAVQAPGVSVVGPYGTLRFKVAASGASAGPSLLARGRASGASTVANSNPANALSAGVSYKLAVVLDSTTLTYYLNGKLCKELPLKKGSLLPGSTGGLAISSSSEGCPCRVEQFVLYPRALSAEEIAEAHA